MYEVNNEKIGTYLKRLIDENYSSQREFCRKYLEVDNRQINEDEIRKMANRISQIIKGSKGVQIFDLPIFTDLLGVSCEQILSAGNVFTSSASHLTNYDVAFSDNPSLWKKYIEREDKIFLNPDEYGKTILDYAFEFKNYAFLKYMVEKNHIWFVDKSGWQDKGYGYGGGTDVKRRDIGSIDVAVPLQLQFEDQIRTNMIALAIENDDYEMLSSLCARENPLMHNISISVAMAGEDKNRNEAMIEALAKASPQMLDFFAEEFQVTNIQKKANTFVYHYLGPVIERMIQIGNVDSAEKLLNKALEHNRKTFEILDKRINDIVEFQLERFGYAPDERVISEIQLQPKGYLYCNEKINMVSFVYDLEREFMTNIIHVEPKTVPEKLKYLVKETNGYYKKIFGLRGEH